MYDLIRIYDEIKTNTILLLAIAINLLQRITYKMYFHYTNLNIKKTIIYGIFKTLFSSNLLIKHLIITKPRI